MARKKKEASWDCFFVYVQLLGFWIIMATMVFRVTIDIVVNSITYGSTNTVLLNVMSNNWMWLLVIFSIGYGIRNLHTQLDILNNSINVDVNPIREPCRGQ